ncbi:MAG: hypothetical protein KJP08_10065, partial [Gammaproteobacteria bacterium]|nr:hypothetical protein [Gammaproteobacteria bacterium]
AQDGADSFGITASDDYQASDEATVSIEIFKWAGIQQSGTAEQDVATTTGLYRTADGGFIFGGLTRGQLGATPLDGAQDAWIRKVDRRGNEQWTRQFGSSDDDNGRIVVADPDGSGTFVIVGQRGAGAEVYKFDNDGLQQLSAPIDFAGQAAVSFAYQGGVDANGDLYILSWASGNSGLITKVDGNNGDTLWQRLLEGANEPGVVTPFNAEWGSVRLRSVDFDAAGNVIITGNFWPSAGPARDCANPCSFLLVYDPNGDLLDSVELNAFARECGQGSDSILYRTSVAPDQALWALGIGGLGNADPSFVQVTKLSADGSQTSWSHCEVTGDEWALFFTYPTFAANGDGLIYGIAEGIENPTTFERDTSTAILKRLAPGGAEVFRTSFTSTKPDGNPAYISAGSVVEDEQGLLYVTGSTDGEFIPGDARGDDDVFLLRLDADGNIQ